MKKTVLLCIILASIACAQPIQLNMDVFAQRREAFMKKMQPGSAAIFPCKPEYMRNGDVEYEYRQESNLYYLSGFEEPQSILLLNPGAERYKYILFVRKRDQNLETWNGMRSGTDGAMAAFRADTAIGYNDFRTTARAFIPKEGPLYYNFNVNPQLDDMVRDLFLEGSGDNSHPIKNSSLILAELRLIKNEGDLAMGLRKAVDISAQAHIEAMKSIAPGMNEMEVQGVFEYVYRKNGSPRNGYPSIVGSGPNSCILHYSENTRQMKSGDVVLMDCAAEYDYYSADITRTVPVNGAFTQEQRAIYRIVLDAQQAGIRLVRPGATMKDLSDAIDSVIGNGLVRLGFLKDKKDLNVFTLHGYSHWIGLEVHDVGSYLVEGKSRPLEAGMCFTIEPGIYIRPDVIDKLRRRGHADEELDRIRKRLEPYLNIGIRIEDDILVTEQGCQNMSASVPREIDEIEKLMKQKGIGEK